MLTAADLYPETDPLVRGLTIAAAGLTSFSDGAFHELDRLLTRALDILVPLQFPNLGLFAGVQTLARGRPELTGAHIEPILQSTRGREQVRMRDIAGHAAWFAGDHGVALEHFAAQEVAAIDSDDAYFLGRALRGRSLMLALQGSPESGALLCERSAASILDWATDRSVGQYLAVRAALELMSSRPEQAERDARAALQRSVTMFDWVPVMISLPIMVTIDATAGRWEQVARSSGWFRGLSRATGAYAAPSCERLLDHAEHEAQLLLAPQQWEALRSDGAAGGLADLIRS